jgi:long-chain acyl-CoA synthetase
MTAAPTRNPISLRDADMLLRDCHEVGLASDCTSNIALTNLTSDYGRLALPPGTLVAIVLPNSRDLLAQYFATILSGLVPMLLPPSIPLTRVFELSNLLSIGACVTTARRANKFTGHKVYEVGAQRLVRLTVDENQGEQYEPGDVVMLTSGTSGMFSACVNQVDALLRNARRHNETIGVSASDTILVILPLYYSYAVVAQALSALVAGARLVVGGPPFSPDGFRTTIENHGVDVSSITPTLARRLIGADIRMPSRLRTLTVGGDQLAGASVGELLALHSGNLYLTYGLTEAGPRVATLSAHSESRDRWHSVGLPLSGVCVSLRNVREDGIGELVVESDTVLKRNAGQVRSQCLVAPGRLATGDLFSIDADGYLFFKGRLRDFVIVHGEKVSLFSMKAAAESIRGVVQAETSVTEDVDGPVIALTVYADDRSQITTEIITRKLALSLMANERPHRVSVVSAGVTGPYK